MLALPRCRLSRWLPALLLGSVICWPFTPLAAQDGGKSGPAAAPPPGDLLQAYRDAVVADPHGSVQQRRQHGSLSLLAAVESSLANSLALQVEQQKVELAEGQYQSQTGAFDWLMAGGVNYGLSATKLDSVQAAAAHYSALDAHQTTSSLSLSKQLRSGPALSLGTQLARNDYRDEGMASLGAGSPVNPKTTAIVRLEAKVPLLNGVGRFASSAERAAEKSLAASRYDYLQATSQNTLGVVHAYWDYKSAFFAYDVNLSLQGMIKGWLSRAEGQPEGQPEGRPEGRDEGAGAAQQNREDSIVLSTLRAKLADATQETSRARQQITATRQALALALGLNPADFASLAVPSEEFHLARVSLPEDSSTYLAHLTTTALAQRPDLKAFTLKVEAAELLVARARNNLKPRLDLVGNIGYTGLNESSGMGDYFAAATDRKDGEAWSVGLTFSYPWGNNTAKGMLQTQQAGKKISEIQQENLVSQISSQLTVDMATLKHWIASLQEAGSALDHYWQALQLSRQNPLASHTDLVSLLDIQEKVRDAAINHSDTLNGFAKAIATTRFNSGTLVELRDEKMVIELPGLTTLP